ncbi:hypothetical protein TrVGV298_008652 [Trichoderma virens]|nr:hypothetical protein TrVGV298_008652 [Trichoderma virens]
MAAAAKKLIVCGGNGFLGSRICKYAVARGWDVTSVSRSGEPRWDSVTSSATPPPWAHKVSWERANILEPLTYAPLLKGSDYVVHSMGILLEADYKGVISGRESPITGLQKAFATVRDRGIDPIHNKPEDTIKPSNPKDQMSYEVMNRDSAISLARHAAAENASAFCFISAAAGAPVLPHRYISTKREAEISIATNYPQMRGIFMRPPFMYDSSRKITMGLAAATVAEAVVEALADETTKGPVEPEQIEELASKGWRKTML